MLLRNNMEFDKDKENRGAVQIDLVFLSGLYPGSSFMCRFSMVMVRA